MSIKISEDWVVMVEERKRGRVGDRKGAGRERKREKQT